jgi:hypothetical protein
LREGFRFGFREFGNRFEWFGGEEGESGFLTSFHRLVKEAVPVEPKSLLLVSSLQPLKAHSKVVIRTDPPVPKPAVLSLPTRLPSEPADHSSDA